MQFSDLKSEFAERGFDDFSDTRRGSFINQGLRELDRLHLWPWREKSVTGIAPVTVTDLGPIEAVTNESLDYRLQQVQFRDLLDAHGDLSTSGVPDCYYVSRPSGDPVVATYPTGTDTIGIQYWKVTVDLAGASDEPASPDDVHPLIVDLAVVRAYRAKDNHEAARELRAEVDLQIQHLLAQYPPGVGDFEGHIVSPGDW
jgi:hypothetical protein